MKKVLLIFMLCTALQTASTAQVQVNVHIYGGERIYFPHPHSWMLSHGYYYSRHGYYQHRNGRRISPHRREVYHAKGNNGKHYGQYKNKSKGHSKNHPQGRGRGHGR